MKSDALKIARAMYRTFLETAAGLSNEDWDDTCNRIDVHFPDSETREEVLAILKGKTPGGAE